MAEGLVILAEVELMVKELLIGAVVEADWVALHLAREEHMVDMAVVLAD